MLQSWSWWWRYQTLFYVYYIIFRMLLHVYLYSNEQTCSLQLSDSVHLWVSWVRQAIHWTFVRKGIIQVKSLLTSHTLTALGQSQKQLASEEHDRSIGLFILSYELLLFPKRGSVDSLKMQQDRTEDRAELVNNKYSFLDQTSGWKQPESDNNIFCRYICSEHWKGLKYCLQLLTVSHM